MANGAGGMERESGGFQNEHDFTGRVLEINYYY